MALIIWTPAFYVNACVQNFGNAQLLKAYKLTSARHGTGLNNSTGGEEGED